jgi:hypothetical protein
MGIIWLLVSVVIALVVVPMARIEFKLRRRAASEVPDGLSGSALRRAKREKLAQLKYFRGSRAHPTSNTSDSSFGCGFDSGGHAGLGGDGGGHGGGHG